jgi:membrane protein YqaA with SNARE-associated domain
MPLARGRVAVAMIRDNAGMASLTILFLAILALNVVPAFAPPTWMALSFFGFRHPDVHPWLVALVAAAGATCGRLVLAHFAKRIVRARWMRPAMRGSLTAVAELIVRRRAESAAAFLVFALSPLPSNVVFLAYGLTGAPLWLLAVPFFVGRLVSYTIAVKGGSLVAQHFESEASGAGAWASAYFVVVQLALLAVLYGFTKVDWRRTFDERRLRWLSRSE